MSSTDLSDISIINPTRYEEASLRCLLPSLKKILPDSEIIVVNDGSVDNKKVVCTQNSVRLINNPYSRGNGGALKSGARAAKKDILVFMGTDGQHRSENIPRLIEKLHEGYDMVVGSRDFKDEVGFGRAIANKLYNWVASWIVQHKIKDLTSGIKAVRTSKFRDFHSILSNVFSYPPTITMAFFRSGLSIDYLSISTEKRAHNSHIRLAQDTMRFFLVIFKIGALFSPFRIFRVSVLFFLIGSFCYIYTNFMYRRFTNMSALRYIASILIFLFGLVSEQITMLHDQKNDRP